MKRKIFYSVWIKDGMKGIKEHDGFEFQIDKIKFHAYKGKDGIVHIIDPMTGGSIFQYDHLFETDEETSELEMVKAAKEKFARECRTITLLKENREKERYKLLVEIFKTYKRAASLDKKLKGE